MVSRPSSECSFNHSNSRFLVGYSHYRAFRLLCLPRFLYVPEIMAKFCRSYANQGSCKFEARGCDYSHGDSTGLVRHGLMHTCPDWLFGDVLGFWSQGCTRGRCEDIHGTVWAYARLGPIDIRAMVAQYRAKSKEKQDFLRTFYATHRGGGAAPVGSTGAAAGALVERDHRCSAAVGRLPPFVRHQPSRQQRILPRRE